MKRIVIDVSEDGEVRLETQGFKGTSCVEEARFLKEILGKETFRELTPAFYETEEKKHVKRYLTLCG